MHDTAPDVDPTTLNQRAFERHAADRHRETRRRLARGFARALIDGGARDPQNIARTAVAMADALIAELAAPHC